MSPTGTVGGVDRARHTYEKETFRNRPPNVAALESPVR